MSAAGKLFLALALMSMLAFGTFGMLSMSMDMQMDGTMGHCPFAPGTGVCTMTPLAHIVAAQSFFITIVSYGDVLALLAFTVLALFASSIFCKSHSPPLPFAHVRIRRRESTRLSYLQEAFSNGILNPKVF